ncbi:hypothetical protein CHS0354_039214 [Potamilus streckersoni]|uniref:Uncharacterized protein n=1 Tax=Potamilus streckersoni TaxID=2493646 RepID=A0AAE0TD84_9BIVA|nr:hypothetical protein CHS0354_039214 [Potamilus streckersoni]
MMVTAAQAEDQRGSAMRPMALGTHKWPITPSCYASMTAAVWPTIASVLNSTHWSTLTKLSGFRDDAASKSGRIRVSLSASHYELFTFLGQRNSVLRRGEPY